MSRLQAEFILANIFESVCLSDTALESLTTPVHSTGANAEVPDVELKRVDSAATARKVHQLQRAGGITRSRFYELTELVARSEQQKELWFALLDVNQNGSIDMEEFVRFQVTASVGFWVQMGVCIGYSIHLVDDCIRCRLLSHLLSVSVSISVVSNPDRLS